MAIYKIKIEDILSTEKQTFLGLSNLTTIPLEKTAFLTLNHPSEQEKSI